jgi:hypothetical protein
LPSNLANLGALLDHNDQSNTNKSRSGVYQIITSADLTSIHDSTVTARPVVFIAWVFDANDEPVIRGPTAPTCTAALEKLLESLSALVSLRLQHTLESFGHGEPVTAFGKTEDKGGVLSRILGPATPVDGRPGVAYSTDEVKNLGQRKGISTIVEPIRKDSSVSWYEGDDEDEDETVVSQIESDHDRASIRMMEHPENQSDSLSWVTLGSLVPQFSDMHFVAPLRVVEATGASGGRSRAKGKIAEYKVGRIPEEPEMSDEEAVQSAADEKKAAMVGTVPSERDPSMIWLKKSMCVIQG